MNLTEKILSQFEDKEADAVAVGEKYAAVKIGPRIGLAHRQFGWREPVDTLAFARRTLAHLILSDDLTNAAVGAAAINAQLSIRVSERIEVFSYILSIADEYKRFGVVGFFPFVNQLKDIKGDANVLVFELMDIEGCLPVDRQDELLPTCDCVVISGSTFANGTLEHLLEISNGYTMVIGPTTPITDTLFEYGADIIAGVSTGNNKVLDVVTKNGGTRAFKPFVDNVFIRHSHG